MHPNPAFRETAPDANAAFARARGFGILSVNGADGPARSPCAVPAFGRFRDGRPASRPLQPHCPRRSAGTGADCRLRSPTATSRPTGTASSIRCRPGITFAVHLRGTLARLPDEALRDHADALSARFEADLGPKPPWRSSKMADGVMERMMRMIVPFRLTLTGIDGTWKLNQNKPAAAREAAAGALAATAGEAPAATLAGLMRAVHP